MESSEPGVSAISHGRMASCKEGSEAVLPSNVISAHSPQTGFACVDCGRCFGAKRGLGIHRGRMHPLAVHREYEEQRLNDSKPRAQWPEDHVILLAEAEAKFTDRIVAVNGFLFYAIGERLGRTKQAIKGKRRNPRYKKLVKKSLAEEVPPSPAMVSPASMHPASSSLLVSDFSESLVSCNSSLGEVEPEVYESVPTDNWVRVEYLGREGTCGVIAELARGIH